jgi:glycosyltransferase involved in cell wall biosynthesis
MSALLRRVAGEGSFDVVHADQLSMAGYGRVAACAGHSSVRSLLDEHNAVYLLTQRMASTETSAIRRLIMRREARAFSRYEAAMCRAYDVVVTVTQQDREHLLALFSGTERENLAGKMVPVPISVDPGQVAPVAHQLGGPPTIIHVGTMFWPPNVGGVLWFARAVLPRIREQAPGVRFVVVGKDPPAEVRALTADPAIEVTGYVPDLSPYLEKADAMVVPLHAGGGMRVKILDGWLWGLPMVSTPIGAEGVDLADGENILLAEGEEAFAAATLRLLMRPDLNQRLRTAGRAWVEAHYSWQAVYQKMDQVYHRLLA